MKPRRLLFISIIISIIVGAMLLVVSLGLRSKTNQVEVMVSNEDLPVSVFDQNGFVSSYNEPIFYLPYTKDRAVFTFVNKNNVTVSEVDVTTENPLTLYFQRATDTTDYQQIIEDRAQVKSIVESQTGDAIYTLRTYDDGNWVLGSTSDNIANQDIEVAVFVRNNGVYTEIASGTGLDIKTLTSAGVPERIADEILWDMNEL